MHRCLQLAGIALGRVAPNPVVGSVLVYQDRIIGEGYHQVYGEGHAEVACIASVKPADVHLIQHSTLYVSLEPCAHFGKTPPCADLIIQHKIPKVVIGCRDPFVQVNGKGIEKLKAAGVEVVTGVLEERCKELNKRFFVFHTEHRPYIILKWAQTADGKIAAPSDSPNSGENSAQSQLKQDVLNKNRGTQTSGPSRRSNSISGGGGGDWASTRLHISNTQTNRLVHKWRSEESAILVGTNTALFDDPELTTRLWPGYNPVRIVVDNHLRLPKSLKLFSGSVPTLVFNLHQHTLPFEKKSWQEVREMGVGYYQVTEDVSLVHQMLNALYRMNIQSVLVEGGAQLLQSFIDEGAWDEARIITNESMFVDAGLPAPTLKKARFGCVENVASDTIRYYHPQKGSEVK